MNDIAVLSSVMSLYKAADAVHSALYDLMHFYEKIVPSMKVKGQHHRKHKVMEKELHEHDSHSLDKHVVRETEPVKVFQQLMQAFKQFDFAFRDFHDYVDIEGDRTLNSLLEEATVSSFSSR